MQWVKCKERREKSLNWVGMQGKQVDCVVFHSLTGNWIDSLYPSLSALWRVFVCPCLGDIGYTFLRHSERRRRRWWWRRRRKRKRQLITDPASICIHSTDCIYLSLSLSLSLSLLLFFLFCLVDLYDKCFTGSIMALVIYKRLERG